jgi:hypothetical protein
VTDARDLDRAKIMLPASAGVAGVPLAFSVSLRADGREIACSPSLLSG